MNWECFWKSILPDRAIKEGNSQKAKNKLIYCGKKKYNLRKKNMLIAKSEA